MAKRKQSTDCEGPVPEITVSKRPKKQTLVTVRSHSARVTRSSAKALTTAAARNAVFGTTELLENILIQLPPRNIFQVQRVSKKFNDVVNGSFAIQKLLLPAAKTGNKRWILQFDITRGVWHYTQPVGRFMKWQYHRVSTLNTAVFTPIHGSQHVGKAMVSGGTTVKFSREHMMQGLLRHMRGQTQSHERMPITEPRCNKMMVSYEIQIGMDAKITGKHIEISKAQGVTVGDIFEAILGISSSDQDGSLGIVQIEERMQLHSTMMSRIPPYNHPVSRTIRQLEEVHETEARVIHFEMHLSQIVTPSEEDILAIESSPRFASG